MSSPSPAGRVTGQQKLEPILAQPAFEGLKAIFERLGCDRELLWAKIQSIGTYEQLLAGLGYKLVLTKQIHVQDSYSRVGPEGGIRAVLPYYDIPTQRSLPTLINFDGTVTTTSNAAVFFEGLLADLRKRLSPLV